MVRFSSLTLILAIWTNSVSAQDRPGASPEQTVALVKAWTDAAAWLAEGRDLLNAAEDERKTSAERTIGSMTQNRLVKNKFAKALQALPESTEFEPQSLAVISLGTYRVAITGLITVLDRSFQISEKALAASNMAELAPLVSESAELAAKLDETWKVLPTATLGLVWVLVDTQRATDGKIQHLRLTRAQRQQILADLAERFPKVPNKLAAGQHAIEASIAVLKQFLAGQHRSADEP
jgi:hypothetical protein